MLLTFTILQMFAYFYAQNVVLVDLYTNTIIKIIVVFNQLYRSIEKD